MAPRQISFAAAHLLEVAAEAAAVPCCCFISLRLYSKMLKCMQGVEWGKSLPPVLLLHGTADTCALVSNATQFSKALEEAGAQVGCLFKLPRHLVSICEDYAGVK